MQKESTLERLKGVLQENQFIALKDLIPNINLETSLINDLALDSIQILDLIVQIEKEFDFSCDVNEISLDMFEKVGTLIEFIESKCCACSQDRG